VPFYFSTEKHITTNIIMYEVASCNKNNLIQWNCCYKCTVLWM